MEEALRYELTNRIPELKDEIYPTNAPETSTKPYLVYARISTRKIKTLEGFTDNQELSFMFSVMAKRYSEMKSLTEKVEDFLMSLPGRYIGKNTYPTEQTLPDDKLLPGNGFYIEDLVINNIHEQYEHELKVNRGIIDFTIYI